MLVFTIPLAVGLLYEWMKGGTRMVISAEARARIDAEIQKYPRKRGALLPALHIVQGELGHVNAETARAVAEIFEIQPVEVMEVVSFYNMFFDAPQPRHHVHVCTNLPCSLRGARACCCASSRRTSASTRRATPPTGGSIWATKSVSARAPTPR